MKYTQDYALTVTLKPVHHKLKIEQQFELSSEEIMILLDRVGAKYTMVCELTKAFNCHWHLILKMPYHKENCIVERSIRDLFRKCKYIGFIYLKPVTEYHNWILYMIKSVTETYKILICKHPIPKNDYGLKFELIKGVM